MPAISTATVTIDADGTVAVSGGLPGEDEQTVSLAGRLLLEMLDHSAAAVETAVPPRLRSIAIRAAAGGRDAFATAGQFASALRRHGPESGEVQAIRGLFERWAATTRGTASPARAVESQWPVPAQGAFWFRVTRALLVGMMLLFLVGAGFVFLAGRPADDPPLVVPASRPLPVQPRRQPGWELLKSERASTSAVPRPSPVRRAGGDARQPTNPTQPDPAVMGR
jgi:hypothetical protein